MFQKHPDRYLAAQGIVEMSKFRSDWSTTKDTGRLGRFPNVECRLNPRQFTFKTWDRKDIWHSSILIIMVSAVNSSIHHLKLNSDDLVRNEATGCRIDHATPPVPAMVCLVLSVETRVTAFFSFTACSKIQTFCLTSEGLEV